MSEAYREMRRQNRAMSSEDARALLERGEWGVLATADDAGASLATPLSYIVMGDTLYFHCAMKGHKLDNLTANPQVCFCVVGATQPTYVNTSFTTRFESVLVHGPARLVQDPAEKRTVLLALCERYLPGHTEEATAETEQMLKATVVVGIAMEHVSGKANRP